MTTTATETATTRITTPGPTTTATETVTGPTKTVTATAPCSVITQPAGLLAGTGSTVQNWIFFVTLAVFLLGLGALALGRKAQ